MNQNKVIILVACHKPDKAKKNEVYIPIHVGRSISKYKEEMKDMIGDDTGDNISEKNPFYCELTAQYWAWKNLNSEYVGLCHYRRYFEKEITVENVDKLLGDKYSMILCTSISEKFNAGEHILRATCMEDTYIFTECIRKVSPDYYDCMMKVLSGNRFSPYNMFVMKKELFDQFAEWQFSVLFEMEKYVCLSGYSRQRRVYAYVAEVMLSIFALKHKLRVKYIPLCSMNDDGSFVKEKRIKWSIRRFVRNLIANRGRFSIGSDAILVGLKNDGISI